MILIAIILGCVIGALIGINMPMISYTYSGYLAIAKRELDKLAAESPDNPIVLDYKNRIEEELRI